MRLAITGVGMVTSLGYGAVGSCAAIEAGLARPREMEDFTVADGEGGAYPVVSHPVSGFAEGFTDVGAWIRLAEGSLSDLLHATALPPSAERRFWDATGLIALAPILDATRFPADLEGLSASLREDYALPLVRLMRRPIRPDHVQALALGHGGLAAALREAWKLLSNHALERVIITGADSYLDAGSLEWLYRNNRLKVPGRPTGLMPGQAGACVLVESEAAAKARSALLGGWVRAVAGAASAPTHRPPLQDLGGHLESVIQEALTHAGAGEPFRGGLLLDLNGEDWKARAWGFAQLRLRSRIDLERCWACIPCESLGETGAASGPLALGVAVSRLRGTTEQALLCSLPDLGHPAAIVLEGH
ncbi:hypothetical protein HPC49_27265 [Pyxidicoccus fallax]|uniref:Beta-ketoacyl synthase N-terminal domain-containing protein n=1 Tax=Pyxidicoccus fallax TaxID=394095 RepID=A0A848LIH0_9BACT|nr:hypothetical protein [Pyxidicoccus fallax]NMO17515.1 hypothetical protein [Pyxidicoccus fallax]NPC81906.1 hypothetical protein [Pyxidicoccus fallax]